MKMGNSYYIYTHINLSNDEVFYIGKGSKRRAYNKRNRSEYWNNIVSKHGYDILLIEEDLSEEKAFELEKYYINKFGRRDIGNGTLVNHTNGGDGTTGFEPWNKGTKGLYTQSEEAKTKISQWMKGRQNTLGIKHTEETKRKMSEAHKGIIFTDEHRKNISESAKNRINKKIK